MRTLMISGSLSSACSVMAAHAGCRVPRAKARSSVQGARESPRAAADAKRSSSPVTGCANANSAGVQRLPRQALEQRPRRGYARLSRKAQQLFAAPTVDRIAHHRVPEVGQVHPDLVRAAGFEPHFEQRRRRRSAPTTRQCVRAGRPPRVTHRHALAVPRIAARTAASITPAIRRGSPHTSAR